MTPQLTAVIAAGLVVASTFALAQALRARTVTVATIQARLATRRSMWAPPGTDPSGSSSTGWWQRAGRRVAVGGVGGWIERRLGPALLHADTTVPDVAGQLVAAVSIAVAVVVLAATGLAAGAVVMVGWWWIVVLPVVVAGFVLSVLNDVRGRAKARQRELGRVVNDFVQLTAVALTTNRSVEEAVGFAADAGDGFGFELLRRTIATAGPMGVAVWTALGALADEYGLEDLRGLCTSLDHQAGVGVSVAGTIRAEAKALRAKHLTAITEEADRANSNLQLPTMGMVFGMVLFLMYPIAMQITRAFR